jgi:hypothetical protein
MDHPGSARAREHELAFLGGCLHADPAAPDELFEVDVSNIGAWIDRALDGLDR